MHVGGDGILFPNRSCLQNSTEEGSASSSRILLGQAELAQTRIHRRYIVALDGRQGNNTQTTDNTGGVLQMGIGEAARGDIQVRRPADAINAGARCSNLNTFKFEEGISHISADGSSIVVLENYMLLSACNGTSVHQRLPL